MWHVKMIGVFLLILVACLLLTAGLAIWPLGLMIVLIGGETGAVSLAWWEVCLWAGACAFLSYAFLRMGWVTGENCDRWIFGED